MIAPDVPTASPLPVEVQAGREYLWCACGRSATQPLCDGSHAGTGAAPLRYAATTTGTIWLCGCRRSARAPLCDGTHNRA